MRYPILQRIARWLCDTPQKQARKSFVILSLQVSRDMKSIAAGPLRLRVPFRNSYSKRRPIKGTFCVTFCTTFRFETQNFSGQLRSPDVPSQKHGVPRVILSCEVLSIISFGCSYTMASHLPVLLPLIGEALAMRYPL